MQLKTINKARYSKHLKITFFAICAYMLSVALGVSTLLIHLIGSDSGGNFWLNVAGVVIAMASLGLLYNKFKAHDFFSEIVYVRHLKAQLNAIYRKQRAIKEAAQNGDATAMAILDFSYRTSQFVYQLDDNTLTMEEVTKSINELQGWANQYQVEHYIDYTPELLKNY